MLAEKLRRIRLLLLDVDGVLTDGTITYDDRGVQIKSFNVKDGLGIRLLADAGIESGIITGRSSEALYHRCRNLGISRICDGVQDKAAALDRLLAESGVSAAEVAFVGDDLPDLPVMQRAGMAIAVADAHETVIETADMVTRAGGGKGAVREVAEAILKARGDWAHILERFVR